MPLIICGNKSDLYISNEGHTTDYVNLESVNEYIKDIPNCYYFEISCKENKNIEVIPLSRVTDKGRITLYSSRVTGDNGHKLSHEQIFNGFYDVVPNIKIEVGRNLVDEEKRRSWLRYGSKMFNELYLCKTPPSSRVRQPPRKP